MTILINAETRLEAWTHATERLVSQGPELNIMLAIAKPGIEGPRGAEARAAFDAFYSSEDEYPLHTVAETIFPGWLYKRHGFEGLHNEYAAQFNAFAHGGWGTYAQRILMRRDAAGKMVYPLHGLVDKMRSEHNQLGPKRSCYELGIAEGEYDIPLYSTVRDASRRRGGPCLAHLSFKLFSQRVHLTAIYRSHDYRYKVPGNLLGLARLQACVAAEVGVESGELVVHSTYAFCDESRSRGALTSLITKQKKILGEMQHGSHSVH